MYVLLYISLYNFIFYVHCEVCAQVLPSTRYQMTEEFLKTNVRCQSRLSLSYVCCLPSPYFQKFVFHFFYILKLSCFMNPLTLILVAAVVTATRGVVSMAAVEPVISNITAWMASRAASASSMSVSSSDTDAVSVSFSSSVQVTSDSTMSSATSESSLLSGVSSRTEKRGLSYIKSGFV